MEKGNKSEMEKENKSEQISIKPLNYKTITVEIIGTNSLLQNGQSPEMKEKLKERQKGTIPRKNRENRDSNVEFQRAISPYRLPDSGGFGHPCSAIRLSMVAAAKLQGIPMTDAKQYFRIISDYGNLIPILDLKNKLAKPTEREDTGRRPPKIGGIDFLIRGEYKYWKMKFQISFDQDLIGTDAIINLLRHAGVKVGIGDWRPEKSGNFGTWELKTSK